MQPHFSARAWAAIALMIGLCTFSAYGIDDYVLGPDSQVQEGVPKGRITSFAFNTSRVFPGTERDCWVYVPAQYDGSKPACVLIVQDGGGFVNERGSYRVPTVLDNLIHKKQIPVTVGIFINPGVIPATRQDAHPRYNRSFEYDSPTALYARFLVDEVLPHVAKEHNLNLSADPNDRAIMGSSSGAICAFTAAWERPDQFRRVISFIGSYTNLRGGHSYASLVRKTEAKPLRVFLQDGENDLDIYSGSWWIGNQDLARALKFAGYEHTTVWGDGAHSGKHGGAILPDALRWVFEGHPRPISQGTFPADPRDTRPTPMSILIPGEEWQVVSQGHRNTEGPSTDAEGNVYFSEGGANRIHKIAPDGKVSQFVETTGGADGMEYGPGNRLYVAMNRTNQIVAFDAATGSSSVIASEIQPNDLVVTQKGHIYVTDHNNRRVWHISPAGEKKVADTGLNFPNGLTLTPDQSQLIVADMRGTGLYAFQIREDGSLANKQLYFFAQIPVDRTDSGADGLTVDTEGRVYAATHMGIQVFDQAGRVNVIIPGPTPGRRPSNLVFGGPSREYLYIAQGDKIFRRKTRARGVLFFEDPVVPPRPRL